MTIRLPDFAAFGQTLHEAGRALQEGMKPAAEAMRATAEAPVRWGVYRIGDRVSDDVDALVAFVRAQHTADEKAAREAGGGQWAAGFRAGVEAAKDRAAAWVVDDIPDGPANAHLIEDLEVPVPEHTARHDPRDTLARIQAERELLGAYEQRAQWAAKPGVGDRSLGNLSGLEQAVRALAYGYRHRPGWQEEWAP